MALGLYSKPVETAKLSEDGDQTTPFYITLDGKEGGAIDSLIYVRNDDISRYYTGITVRAVDTSGGWLTNGTQGFSWKLKEGSIRPLPQQWSSVSDGNTLSLSDNIGTSMIGDIITYLPIWIRVQIPRNESVATIKTVVLRISATEGYIE